MYMYMLGIHHPRPSRESRVSHHRHGEPFLQAQLAADDATDQGSESVYSLLREEFWHAAHPLDIVPAVEGFVPHALLPARLLACCCPVVPSTIPLGTRRRARTHTSPTPQFSVYFLERQAEGQTSPECTIERATTESERYLNTMSGVALELTHNHGTEDDDSFKVWSGNTGRDAGEPGSALYAEEPAARGFGHIAFNCDDVYAATDTLLAKCAAALIRTPYPGSRRPFDPVAPWILSCLGSIPTRAGMLTRAAEASSVRAGSLAAGSHAVTAASPSTRNPTKGG
jgi:hypothetical protein